MMEQHFWM